MNTIENDGVSIIIPVYNENLRLVRSLDTLLFNSIFLFHVFKKVEIIIVNDGSKNDIKQIIKYKKNDFVPIFTDLNINIEFKYVSYKKNKGKGFAIKTGIEHCTKYYTWIMDCDLSIPLQDFIKGTIDLSYNKYDVVLGNRKFDNSVVSNYSNIRKFLSKKYNNYIYKNIFKNKNNEYTDVQCPCKIFKTINLKSLQPHMKIDGFCYDTELLMLMIVKKYKIKQIPVTFYHDSKESKVKLFSSSIKMFKELQKIKKRFKEIN